MSQRVKTSARGLVLPRSSSPENGHLRKNGQSIDTVNIGNTRHRTKTNKAITTQKNKKDEQQGKDSTQKNNNKAKQNNTKNKQTNNGDELRCSRRVNRSCYSYSQVR